MRMKEPLPHLEYKRSSGVRVSDLTFEEDELTDDEEQQIISDKSKLEAELEL